MTPSAARRQRQICIRDRFGSEIYSESRFFIIGHDDWDKLEYFINSSVKPMDYDSLYKFSPDKMMSTIVSDFIDK